MRKAIYPLFLLLGLLLSTGARAAEEAGEAIFQVYGQFEKIVPTLAIQEPGKIEVVELFWYGCPHCYHFDPYLERWLKTKPDYVTFRRVPAVFRESWIPQARAYYAAEAMGVLDSMHGAIFDAIHRDKRTLDTRDQLADFFAERGVDREQFLKVYNSFGVQTKVRQAISMTKNAQISGVPSMVVDGKYRTSGSLAGTFANMIKVLNILVDEEHRVSTLASTGTHDGDETE